MADDSGTPARSAAAERLQVAIAWIYVGIPLAWGVTETVLKSIALFR
jgi:hypothetical protein